MDTKSFIYKLKKLSLLHMVPSKHVEEPYVLFQNLCNEVFGVNIVPIKPAPSNNIIGTLCYKDEYIEFKKNLKNRLVRLRDKYQGTLFFNDLLTTIKNVADYNNWEGAYAELVAYDILWNKFVSSPLSLNNTFPASESYAQEMGYKETNEDGFIPDMNLYFDVKILSDTVGHILKGIIDKSLKNTNQRVQCSILPEYPLDDDEDDYNGRNRGLLCKELTTYLAKNNQKKTGTFFFKSLILPRLGYRIQWGGGINSTESCFNPYRHAEETRHLVFKRYTKKIMKNQIFMLVFVNFPWYNNKIIDFGGHDDIYYRSLARRTFCEYKNSKELLRNIVKNYQGDQTIFEVSRHLAGIIFINDNSIKEDSYKVNVMLNPNTIHNTDSVIDYLRHLVCHGVKGSIIDDFRYDNY